MTVKKYTREELETHFANNREIEFNSENYGIMDWENGTFDVLKEEDNENGYVQLNEESFICHMSAIEFLINHILSNQEANKKAVKSTALKAKKKEPEEIKYEGPTTVRVFGREIYIEDDNNATNEIIRQKLVEHYGFPHFRKDNVYFDYDLSTKTLEVMIKMQVKG